MCVNINKIWISPKILFRMICLSVTSTVVIIVLVYVCVYIYFIIVIVYCFITKVLYKCYACNRKNNNKFKYNTSCTSIKVYNLFCIN